MYTFKFNQIVKNVADISIQETVLTAGPASLPHGHDFYELFFVSEGIVVQMRNGHPQYMAAGSIALAGPEDIHSFRKGRCCESARFYNLAFGAPVFEQLPPALQKRLRDCAGSFLTPAEQSFLLYEIGQLNWVDNRNQEIVAALSSAILQTAIALLAKNSLLGDEGPPVWLERSIALMSQPGNLAGGICKMVELANVSQEHLTRSLVKYYHITPSRLIGQLRMEWATRMLRESGLPITTIALQCGYNSISYFNRTFKALYKDTPSGYRRRCERQLAATAITIQPKEDGK